MHQKQPSLHPFLRKQHTQRTNWKKPRAKVKPFTSAMFDLLHQLIQNAKDLSPTFVGPLAAVFDWTCLGIFTGLRLGEYGQSRCQRTPTSILFPNLWIQVNGQALPSRLSETIPFFTRPACWLLI
jgi:hypothetical protein